MNSKTPPTLLVKDRFFLFGKAVSSATMRARPRSKEAVRGSSAVS